MLFNSFEFLFIFFPILFILFYFVVPTKYKMVLLLLGSYIFYGYWNYNFLPLVIFSSFCDYYLGKKIYESNSIKKEKLYLLLSIFINLGTLAFFKYFNFAIENVNFLLRYFDHQQLNYFQNIILPVGISFYTFQSMSYTIDVYRNHSKPYKNFISFATYVALFPQLIAGPIVRHSDLVDQLEESVQKVLDSRKIALGILYFTIGLSKKLLIADRIASAINPIIGMMDIASTVEAWACALGYTLQLYFDFSGYSDMAIGLGLLLGVSFPQNFNSPYKSFSITEFWQRWHMTLGSWLRDYLYIPLGGNRKGKFRTFINLFTTLFLGGLWHGAAWTFILWGCFHGVWLVIERFLHTDKLNKNKIFSSLQYILTFFLIVIGWVIFRSENIDLMSLWLKKMFIFEGPIKPTNFTASTRDRFAAAMIIGLYIVWGCKNTFEIEKKFTPSKKNALLLGILLFISLLFMGENSPFLYFQF